MSSSDTNVYASRQWMYNRIDQTTRRVSDEFVEGLRQFIAFVQMQPICMESGRTLCPCRRCKNQSMQSVEVVVRHLYDRGFVSEYYVWCFHGEDPSVISTAGYGSYYDDIPTMSTGYHQQEPTVVSGHEPATSANPYVEMVADAFHGGLEQSTEEEVPNRETKRFYDMLESANQPIYEGCREGHSRLALAARMMHTKTDYNVGQNCMDSFCQTMHEYLPQPNHAPQTYYETQKTVKDLGMPVIKINVCFNNCMIC